MNLKSKKTLKEFETFPVRAVNSRNDISAMIRTGARSTSFTSDILKKLATLDSESIKMVIKTLQGLLANQGKMKEEKSMGVKNENKSLALKLIMEHRQKQILKETMVKEIKGQLSTKMVVESLLKESPLAGVWQGLRGGAQALGKGVADAAQAFGNARAQGKAASQAQAQTKAAVAQMTSALKASTQARQKFQAEILKNAENVNAYHDAVVGLFQTWQQIQPMVASNPSMVEKFNQEVMNSVGQLQVDLESEKEQLDAFLKVLNKSAPQSDWAASDVKKATQSKRDEESKESGGSSYGKDKATMKKSGLNR